MSVCARCGQENPGPARFCPACGAPLRPGEGRAGERAREERKVVTVLFCDLVGFTARSDNADPEDVRARLVPYHGLLRREVERFGDASLLRYLGVEDAWDRYLEGRWDALGLAAEAEDLVGLQEALGLRICALLADGQVAAAGRPPRAPTEW